MSKCRKTSFCELKFKDVINICDGRMLGRVVDTVIDISCGRITGLIVPGDRGWSWFRRNEDVYIPWRNILRIGEDVILVEIFFKEKPCRVKPKRGWFSGEDYAASAAISQIYDDKEQDELRPKVLKYITASVSDEESED